MRHYNDIAKGMEFIRSSLECYIEGGICQDFQELVREVDKLEDRADKTKRGVRNHLPRGLFMAVDKTLFFNYTRSQDNILDCGQEALNWLGMRAVTVPEEHRGDMLDMLEGVAATVALLKPALDATMKLVHGAGLDRQDAKEKFRAVRKAHHHVWKSKAKQASTIYNSDMDFKDIHQLLHVLDCLYGMSHNAENCADILRAMIAR